MSLHRLPRLALLLALLAPASWPAAARASSVIVPDAYPTIQTALNSHADTVFVRAGVYAESPTLFAQVVLQGIAGDPAWERPMLTSLTIMPITGTLPKLTINEVDLAGDLTIQNNTVRSSIVWYLSRLHGQVSDVSTSTKTASIRLQNCQVVGDAFLQAAGDCVIDKCEFDAHLVVAAANCRLSITSTRFKGKGVGVAVSTQGVDLVSATLTDNVVNGYESGFSIHATRGTIARNVVWGNAGDGISLFASPVVDSLVVRNNTSAFNGGSGFVSSCPLGAGARFVFAGNIGASNKGYGIRWSNPQVSLVQCNDWFANALGAVQGRAPSPADLSLSPRFCDPTAGDFHLSAGSPLLNAPGCGLVGALGSGCGATTDAEPPEAVAFRLDRVGPSPARGQVRIEFELPRAAAIQLDVFDVLGRLVASPARGAWAAGRHVVGWNDAGSGPRAAAGVYLVRYRYPGGEARRRVLVTP